MRDCTVILCCWGWFEYLGLTWLPELHYLNHVISDSWLDCKVWGTSVIVSSSVFLASCRVKETTFPRWGRYSLLCTNPFEYRVGLKIYPVLLNGSNYTGDHCAVFCCSNDRRYTSKSKSSLYIKANFAK